MPNKNLAAHALKKVAFFDAEHLVEMNITFLRIPVTGSIYKL